MKAYLTAGIAALVLSTSAMAKTQPVIPLEDKLAKLTEWAYVQPDYADTLRKKDGKIEKITYTRTDTHNYFRVVFTDYIVPEEDIMEFVYYPAETKHLPPGWQGDYSRYQQMMDPSGKAGVQDYVAVSDMAEGKSVHFIDYHGDGYVPPVTSEIVRLDPQTSKRIGLEEKQQTLTIAEQPITVQDKLR